MQTEQIRIGTRGSPLALAQAHEVRQRLMAAHGMAETSIVIDAFTTTGDQVIDRPLSDAGGKGLFTKEIEEALLDKRIDIAVHSTKDMPTLLPTGLEITAYLEREDPRDAFIGRQVRRIADLPYGAVVGSASLRRQALLRRMRPDLKVQNYRGNVQTRLRKLEEGLVDGTLLAHAGLKRLGLAGVVTELLPLDTFPPAPGQGAICVETRTGDQRTAGLVMAIHHRETGTTLACERAFLATLDGSCRTPIAGHAWIEDDVLRFFGMVLTPDGVEAHVIDTQGAAADAAAIGRQAGADIRDKAGTRFFDSWG